MPGGLFSRLKNWSSQDNVIYSDLNSEFNNIIANLKASLLSGASATLIAFRTTLSPGAVGTENLPISIQDELQELRYMVQAITGGAQWYSAPALNLANISTTLSGISTTPQSRIISGRQDSNGQPMFLVPDGSAATIALKAALTNFNAYFNGTNIVFSSDLSVTSLSTAASSGNTCLVNDPNLAAAQSTKTQGERGSLIGIDTIGASISALNGTYAAFKTNTEYFIAEVDTTNGYLKNCFRGVGFDNADAWKARVGISDNDTITLMKLTWVFATYNSTTPGLSITYNKPTVSYLTPTGPAIGDYWYDIANNTWKTYNGSAWVTTIAVFAGICIQDTTKCVLARSADFYHVYSLLNTFDLEYVSSTAVRSTRAVGQQCSVYGTTYSYNHTHLTWNTAATLDSGESLTATTTYYCYLTNLGDIKVSSVRPSERKFDLLGSYHPAKPYRCVGEFVTDAGSNIQNGSVVLENDSLSSLLDTPRNFLANGDFDFAQRIGTTGSLASISTSQFVLDRWRYRLAASSAVVTISQDTTVPTLVQSGWQSSYSTKIHVTTADSSVGSGDLIVYEQYIEGPVYRQLKGKLVTFSFWIRSGKVGTHCAYFQNNGSDRSYVAEFSIGTANTWEKKIITATLNPIGGTDIFLAGNTGLRVGICLMGGSTFQTTANAWQTGNFNCTSNQVAGLDSTSTDIYLAQMCLNLGGSPVNFLRYSTSMAGEEAECARFWEKNHDLIAAPTSGSLTAGTITFLANGTAHRQPVLMRVRKCKSPTITLYNPNSGGTGTWRDNTASADRTVAANNVGETAFYVLVTSSVDQNSMSGYYTADAELT